MPLLAALAAFMLLSGLVLVAAGGVRQPVRTGPARFSALSKIAQVSGPTTASRRQASVLAIGVAVGALLWLLTGWLVALVAAPAAMVGLPALLKKPDTGHSIAELEALEEWSRNLSGLLVVGSGIEQALMGSGESAPRAIQPQVSLLVARLKSRWDTEKALRAFAEDLDDATGDLVASSLILGARRRGPGLASVLDGLASTVAEEVRMRRAVEADRSKPRTTARAVTIITLVVLALLSFNTAYIAPYGTALGQLVLSVLLGCYVAALVWMQAMTRGKPTPRFLPPPQSGAAAGQGV